MKDAENTRHYNKGTISYDRQQVIVQLAHNNGVCKERCEDVGSNCRKLEVKNRIR